MARLTLDELRARRWRLFKDTTVKQYTILFWLALLSGVCFLLLTAWLLVTGRQGAWIAGVIAVALLYLGLHAPLQPWATKTETEASPAGGLKTTTTRETPLDLAGDRDPAKPPMKQPDSSGEKVSVEVQPPEQRQESPPPRE